MIRFFSMLVFASGLVFSQAKAADAPATPVTSVHANCVAFAWSETDGNVTKDLANKALDLQLNQRVDLFKSPTATYQVMLDKSGRIFIDVLNPSGSRLAASFGELTLGPSVGEPDLQTQIFCFVR